MIRAIEAGATIGTMVGGSGVILGQIPGVSIPDNLQQWPAQALMALITLVSISVMCFVFKAHLKNIAEHSKGMTESAVALARVAKEQKALNLLQMETNTLLHQTVAKLDLRPCMAEDLVAIMKKTQRIKVEPEQ